jgi:hypothetical protein
MSELALDADTSHVPQDQWVELARREGDRYQALIFTLGGAVLPETPAMLTILHEVQELSSHREGTLGDLAPVYSHPMAELSSSEAQLAYPTSPSS